jgi:feruloyl esterase
MALVSSRILEKCDALDGVVDGMVSDTAQCQSTFSIATDIPNCTGTADGSCLTAAQKTAFARIFGGPRNSAGAALYNSWPIDPGIGAQSWRIWKLGVPGVLTAGNVSLGVPAMAFIFSTPPANPGVVTGNGTSLLDYALGFNFDTDAPRIFATNSTYAESSMSFMTPSNPADLSTLRNRGGKIMVVHGAADPVFSLDDTLGWYAGLNAAYAGAASAFVRVFPVPGMNHCAGGPATDQFDMVPALVNWVEKGVVPESIVATSRTAAQNDSLGAIPPNRTRPLCAYPKVSRYQGTGSIEGAANFACR